MSRGIVGKALKGAAAVGVPAALIQHEARIMEQRDARLHKQDLAIKEKDQSFTTSEREASQEHTSAENTIKRLFEAETEDQKHQRELNKEDRSHTRAKELIDYRADVASERGGSDTANMKDVKAMVSAGVFEDEKSAWESLKDTSKISDIVRITNMLHRDQEYRGVFPEDEGYKTPRQLFDEAKEVVAKDSRRVSQPPPPPGGDVATPATQADFDALPAGTRYINPSDGKEYIKN